MHAHTDLLIIQTHVGFITATCTKIVWLDDKYVICFEKELWYIIYSHSFHFQSEPLTELPTSRYPIRDSMKWDWVHKFDNLFDRGNIWSIILHVIL